MHTWEKKVPAPCARMGKARSDARARDGRELRAGPIAWLYCRAGTPHRCSAPIERGGKRADGEEKRAAAGPDDLESGSTPPPSSRFFRFADSSLLLLLHASTASDPRSARPPIEASACRSVPLTSAALPPSIRGSSPFSNRSASSSSSPIRVDSLYSFSAHEILVLLPPPC
ncbi:hypothetical protein GQ55_8G140400 [Panicum hallii var. hallii]|uniref:Uncharacterized protein n=1 Tax=Panicum hallii var. hallii TaxID=1504633 RepID=A0A2T7CN36_9POAL|nr:hypothetical protein GQ55_8G140400 [Panicum hallii var. hallii]